MENQPIKTQENAKTTPTNSRKKITAIVLAVLALTVISIIVIIVLSKSSETDMSESTNSAPSSEQFQDEMDEILSLKESERYQEAINKLSSYGNYYSYEQRQQRCYILGQIYLELSDYRAAEEAFRNAGDYSNAKAQLAALDSARLLHLQAGDVITFGSYEQDNNTANGAEPIEWIVLSASESKCFLISKYILDGQPMSSKETTFWTNTDLKTWLNTTFMETAFTSDQQNAILSEQHEQSHFYNGELKTDVKTEEKIYLLSYNEVSKYYPSDNDYWENNERSCTATPYALTKLKSSNSDNYRSWWLRNPRQFKGGAAKEPTTDFVCVSSIGATETCAGIYVSLDTIRGVRPVMRVDFSLLSNGN